MDIELFSVLNITNKIVSNTGVQIFDAFFHKKNM